MKEEKKPLESNGLQTQIRQYIREKGGASQVDAQALAKDLLRQTYQALLDAEMEEHLGYEKHDPAGRGSGNTRNGYGQKMIKGDFGQAEITVPRDRQSTFEPQVVPKRSSAASGFDDKIISLYARGLTTREIEAHLKEIYGVDVSPSFISKATEKVMEQVIAWQSRSLEKLYPVVYLDGIRFSVRDNGQIVKKVVYIALGIRVSGRQEVLGLWIASNEGASFWLNVCNELKNRGIQDILIACVDGLKGLPEAIESVFPGVDVQLCVVHQIRNSTKFISYKDRKPFCKDLKKVYGATTIEAAEHAMDELEVTWKAKYPASVQSWRTHWDKLTVFFKYPVELRKIIYTTNSIESLNASLRKNTRNRKVFPNDESLLKILFLNIENITKKWRFRQHWDIVINQLSMIFEDRFSLDALD